MSEPVKLSDPGFCPHSLNKYASLLATGNGYLGCRASHEEAYARQTRGMYLAGLYHRAGKEEINELVNLPDVIGTDIELNGEMFTLLSGVVESWRRELDFNSGELKRTLVWRAPGGARFAIESRRFASVTQLPLLAMTLSITPLDAEATISLSTGIDATLTNHGRQHLDETQVRVFGQHLLQGIYTTQDGRSDIAISTWCRVQGEVTPCFTAKERRLMQHSTAQVQQGQRLTLEKLSWIEWTCGRETSLETWARQGQRELERCATQGYDALLAQSAANWRDWWQRCRVAVDSSDDADQRALDFALYHLRIMTPAHDERSSIGAKGMTGEGYKGHVFWDTEVFLLPFHLFTEPSIARSLLRYRWHNLPAAREKARRNGWHGALFPWESARSGEEETPEFAAINIRTGLRQKVASAQAEHHLVADIAWAVVAYWQATKDEQFMAREGLALLLETARFWISRATEVNGRLEIHDVIGPDEYTEHVNNNAFTNSMAHYNVAQALDFARRFGCTDEAFFHRAAHFLAHLWLPQADEEGVVPQDDTFLTKPVIDLSAYKAKAGKQTILLDYSRAEVNEMQILKQADVVMLTYMLPERFSAAECLANLRFYEPRTIHDSSLSKSIHGIVAARCGDAGQGYRFWREGTLIDLGDDPHSSDDGIHAAATGAIWLGAIQGFGGLSVREGILHLNPALPEAWRQLTFPLRWQGSEMQISLSHQQVRIASSRPVTLCLNGTMQTVCGEGNFILSVNGTATTCREGE
ncbi:glycoside hydrolase family 65 protein [Citrobacter rodentium]|uniref:Glycosyl hydrolase n=2 Tax=Citrobacter rodentium TaxID=67825 RepID=D2TKA8_CITRI|nr:glycoside hydrolase family 65 protein [Citrobacter rodentium]KIQ49433.1 glycosyl hydrolase family 65 [Citrobacter rodentium]QBY28263.1 glycoside hydrolase family 65 protein [Citrobacter rodentium]UHO29863.1 glycoside hydrolase family 65 protein [Citrobacter rodentium NBRC 105723 = DSM 16636]CBG88451.1 putative glycosyl hydrolase [Citrobacter rodentium ICC168]HAT8013446.1 glycoside hydrolase family 65 protein [Citrobacter rodentium NBRC 105723 = DSM 16636]